MNSEEPKSVRGESKPAAVDSYVAVAAEIGDAPARSREGLGAFRHYERIFHESVDLVIGSSFFAPPKYPDGLMWYLDHPFAGRFYRKPTPSQFFVNLLGSPDVYVPRCIWAMFWALVQAEHQFLTRYLPYWSNEERLTGHLTSLVFGRLSDHAAHWSALNADGANTFCRVYYADTATARRERETGADLGLIIHGAFSGQRDFFKTARFQAKKVGTSGHAKLDVAQTQALLKRDHVGYYLFYHAPDAGGWTVPPTVMPASAFEKETTEHSLKPHAGPNRMPVPARDWGFDFATFLTFALSDPTSERGAASSDPQAAVSALYGPTPVPSRILVVTLGAPAKLVNWDDVLSEYVRFGQTEE